MRRNLKNLVAAGVVAIGGLMAAGSAQAQQYLPPNGNPGPFPPQTGGWCGPDLSVPWTLVGWLRRLGLRRLWRRLRWGWGYGGGYRHGGNYGHHGGSYGDHGGHHGSYGGHGGHGGRR